MKNEFTDAERIVIDWHNSLLDSGHSHGSAIEQMLLHTPIDGPTWKVLESADFRKALSGTRFWGPLAKTEPEAEQKIDKLLRRHQCRTELPTDLEFQAVLGAPGVGQSWKCRECDAAWIKVGDAYHLASDFDGDDCEPPWILSKADTA